jgi:hypothetical protein
MLAGMIASIVSYPIDRHSFYDHLKYQYLHDLTLEKEKENTEAAGDEKKISDSEHQ